MRYVTSAVVVILLAVIVTFSVQNLEAVEVSFLVWSVSMSKVFVILGSYLVGMLTGWGLVELLKRLMSSGG